MTSDANLRRRKADTSTSEKSASQKLEAEDRVSLSVLDILRVLAGLFLLNSALSWYVTNDSILWGFRPWWTSPTRLKSWMSGPVELTEIELAKYDGTNPSLPIYLAINSSIFDVSANPGSYGPGGSYHFFAGRDATRAYVTGCFETDISPDFRGVERMFLPKDTEGDSEGMSSGELKKRRELEKRTAERKVREAVGHWEKFFANHEKYFLVGKVKREKGWLERLEKRTLCEKAEMARPTREVKKGT